MQSSSLLPDRLTDGHVVTTVFWFVAAGTLLVIAILLNSNLLMPAQWLTLVGQAGNPDSEMLQIDKDRSTRADRYRVVHLRVNHGTARHGPSGVAYRSFDALVDVDCELKRAHYSQASYYSQPNFKGKVVLRRAFDRGEEPPVRLLSFAAEQVTQVVELGCS